jgi:membrane protease YdiL (CAAX protease family)
VPVARAKAKTGRPSEPDDTGASKGKGKGDEGGEKAAAAETPVVLDADGNPVDKPRYGGGAVFLTFLVAQVLSTAAYIVASSNTDYDFNVPTGVGAAVGEAARQVGSGAPIEISVPPPLWLTALMQVPLWASLALVPIWFATKRGRGVVADLGLRMKAIDVPVGLAIGVASQLLLVPALYWLIFKAIGTQDVSAEARALTDRATDPLSILLVFVVVAIGAPLAEEIYFRGFAQRIFGRRVRPHWAILFSALFFAASHVQPLQFPALLVFGLILGWLAYRTGRLGTAIWAHLGFNTVTAVALLFNLG